MARWIKLFQAERRTMEDDAHTGQLFPSIDNTSNVFTSTSLDEDRRMIVWKMEGA